MGYAYGIEWTDELVQEKISLIVNTLDINHFPTHSDMENFYGNKKLSNRISKSGGTRYWADRMNLPIKNCESEFGNKYELLAIKQIKENVGLESYQTKPRYPYDLVTDNKIKVEVKVAYPHTDTDGVTTSRFNLEKTEPTCDIFILYCLKDNGDVYKTLIIPSCVLKGQKYVGVGLLSRWDHFQDKWSYLTQYSEFYEDVLKNATIYDRRRSKDVDWS